MATKPHEKQLRVQGPRSSLGCQTCKSRRVKCDMRKPQCQRCVRTGRTCDYLNGPVAQPVRRITIYSVSGSPLMFPDLDGSAQRALHYYRTRIASAIALPFGSELWTTIAIQMSAKYDFVMSALIALSSMYELYLQPSASRSSLQLDGIRHYNKAIRDIIDLDHNENSTDAILVTCIAFYVLESLRGSWTRTLQHGLSGMQIIEERRRRTPQESQISVEVLDETFLALQNQVMELGGQDEARIFKPTNSLVPCVPLTFTSVDEALHHLNVIYNESAYLLYCYNVEQTSGERYPGELSVALEQRVGLLQARMGAWTTAMQKLWSLGVSDTDYQQLQAISILKIYHATFQYALNGLVEGTPCDYTKALDHAEIFFNCQPQRERPSSRTYSISLGVIPVLFMLATQGDTPLQERSLKLLRENSRREGPWDSEVAVRLAEKVLETKKNLIESSGGGINVSILEINFIDDTKCQITYSVMAQGPYTGGAPRPATVSNESWKHFDVVDVSVCLGSRA